MLIHNDCKFFKGDIPCKPHKQTKAVCSNCTEYSPIKTKILILKLGAAGDVIRTTPILHYYKKKYPQAEIIWVTHYPVLVPKTYTSKVLKWDFETCIWLLAQSFDIFINLDKDPYALGFANQVQASQKIGYLADEYGKCKPADQNAKHKWLTGIRDDLTMKNRYSYPQEVFQIIGQEFNDEKYILELPFTNIKFNLPKDKKIIGLNTGCGNRWTTRLWGEENWITLSKELCKMGYIPLLLGGPYEDNLNKSIAQKSEAVYLGYFELGDFLNLVNRCQLVVTSVTMAMHIAIGLNKKLVLLNNIFNKYEFYLYGLGCILEPEGKDCLGCYKNTCPTPCMSTIPPQKILKNIVDLLEN